MVSPRYAVHACMAIAVAAFLGACASPQNQAAPRAPESTPPGLLSVTTTEFIDSDDNGYRDSATVIVYVFADSVRYQLPMRAAGEFGFRLTDPSGAVIAEWMFDRQQTAAAMRDLAPGPGYVFQLDLLELGSDKLKASEAELLCTFRDDEGRVVRTRTKSPLVIGPTGQGPGTR